jgi:hypothetical protein
MLALMRAAAGSSEVRTTGQKLAFCIALHFSISIDVHVPISSSHLNTASQFMALQDRMHALLACGSVQAWLAAEGKCLVPWNLVDAVAKDDAVKANAVVRRDLGRFVASLPGR